MAEKPETDITGAQWVRALALARGLDRAHALFPATVAAAVPRNEPPPIPGAPIMPPPIMPPPIMPPPMGPPCGYPVCCGYPACG